MRRSVLVLAVLAGAVGTACAEPWYPPECGALDHCGRVGTIAWVEPGGDRPARLVVTTASGTQAQVRRPFATDRAPDGGLHVCMRYDAFGDFEVTCLMVPHLGF
jgi:hypothetical protein